ncbi:MAG TPA: sugar ABC transporter permease [Propionibacteriaceae bacterium]|jgi:multiple sugar transport system permease protein
MSTTVETPSKVAPAKPGRRRLDRRRQHLWAVAFLAPAILSLLVLRVLPTVDAVVASAYKAFPGGLVPATFTGLGNYQELFGNPAFLETLRRTLIFNLVINPLQIGLALLIAVILVQRVRLAGLWQTLIFVPVTIPIVGSCIAWSAALQPEGPVNALLGALGGSPQPFFNSPTQAFWSIILVASWIGIGYWMLFLIAGLRNVPTELYEAARIDRAGPLKTFFLITLPLIKRPILFVLVADTVANFVLFVPVQLLTKGGPESSTTFLMFDAYRVTFGYGSRNLGAAEVVILTAIMLFFVMLQFRLLREDKDRG